MPVVKKCDRCEKEFLVSPRRSDEVRFCSRECKAAAGRVALTCGCCGVQFEKKKSEVSRSLLFFCSPDCYKSSQKGKPKNVSGHQRYHKKCEVCAKEFRVTLTRKDEARFCSRECQAISPAYKQECSERQLREKSWRWSGGVYYSSSGYVATRDAMLGSERIGEHRLVVLKAMLELAPWHPFLTQKDGKWRLSRDIEVHHIDRDRSNNELSNLLAVTKEAHAQIHHNNTKPKPWECWPINPKTW